MVAAASAAKARHGEISAEDPTCTAALAAGRRTPVDGRSHKASGRSRDNGARRRCGAMGPEMRRCAQWGRCAKLDLDSSGPKAPRTAEAALHEMSRSLGRARFTTTPWCDALQYMLLTTRLRSD